MKQAYYITFGIVATVIFLWSFFILKPQLAHKTAMRAELNSANTRLEDYQRILQEFHTQFQAHQELIKKKEHLLSQLYTKDDIMRLFDEIYLKSSQHDITISEITPSVEELISLNKIMVEDNQPLHLDISIKMKANTINTAKFIKDIEEQDYYKGFNFCRISNNDINDPNANTYYSFKAILGMIKDS